MEKIRPKKVKGINEKTLLSTVDLGKAMNMGYYRCPDGTEAKPFEFANNGQGFEKFWGNITKAKSAHNLDEIVVDLNLQGSMESRLCII